MQLNYLIYLEFNSVKCTVQDLTYRIDVMKFYDAITAIFTNDKFYYHFFDIARILCLALRTHIIL